MTDYRMVPLEKRDGVTNTALDEAFLGEYRDCPLVIFSSWEPTVSVSYKQNLRKDVDVQRARERGLDLVRRKSGGRTVYVDGDYVGFKVIEPRERRDYDITGIYREWCERIPEALEELGIDSRVSGNDIMVDGKKIGNAAQINKRDYVIVHGSLRVEKPDLEEMLSVLKIDGEPLSPYEDEAREVITSVEEEGGDPEDVYPALIETLCPGSEEIGLNGVGDEITELREFYSDEEWLEGSGDEPSRGPCDFIFGKTLMIPSLRGKVEFV